MSAGQGLLALGLPLLLGWGLLGCLGVHRRDDCLAWPGWLLLASGLGTGAALDLWLWAGGAPDGGAVCVLGLVAVVLWAWTWTRTGWRRAPASEATRCPSRPEQVRVREWEAGLASGPPPEQAPTSRAGQPGAWPMHGWADWQRLLFGLVLAVTLAAAVLTMLGGNGRALDRGDDAMFWTLKARLIQSAGGFGSELQSLFGDLDHPDDYWAPMDRWVETRRARLGGQAAHRLPGASAQRRFHQDYPLLDPLLQLWVFCCAGRITPWQSRVPVQLLGLALLLLLAGALRQVCSPARAAALLLMVFALHETRDALRHAYADGMLAAGLLLAADSLRRFVADGRRAWLGLACLGAMLLVWSKHEGLMDLIALLLGLACWRLVPRRAVLSWLLAPALVLLSTWAFNARFGLANDLAAGLFHLDPSRLPTLLGFSWAELWSVPWWSRDASGLAGNGLSLALLGLLALGGRRGWAGWSGAMGLTLLAILVGQIGVYLATPHDLLWHLQTSARRLAWQSLPLTALWIGVWAGKQPHAFEA